MNRPNGDRLPHLIRLLDDESPMVREAVTRELANLGEDLGPALARLSPRPAVEDLALIREILADSHRRWIEEEWPRWFDLEDEAEKLETALSLLAEWQTARLRPRKLEALLDDLASDYRSSSRLPDPLLLAEFLFEERGFRGESRQYYDPDNSNLISVIETGRGIPISLCLVYMLVGNRLGLGIEGCNFPGHFLARIHSRESVLFVDCFHGGRLLHVDDFVDDPNGLTPSLRAVLHEAPTAETIVARVLNNLARAYKRSRQPRNRQLMRNLLRKLQEHLPEPLERRTLPDPASSYAFRTGQLVRHRRYGYRGVVVAADPECTADDAWYRANRTQPRRDQPWYTVLVDGGEQVTYAAQSSLMEDDSGSPISHPLLNRFFHAFRHGRYLRNDQPWPRRDLRSQ